jgi:hypothetical protein
LAGWLAGWLAGGWLLHELLLYFLLLLVAGCWLLVAGCWLLSAAPACFWLLAAAGWLLLAAPGCCFWLLLLAARRQWRETSCRPPCSGD